MVKDLVLHHGVIHTGDPACPRAEAVAICGSRVLAVGPREKVLASTAGTPDEVDLQGRCVVPGLVDAHLHFELSAFAWQQVDAEAPTLEEVQRRVAERVAATAPGTWILGWGWNQNLWGGAFPDHRSLDAVAPDHPVFLSAKSGHAGWANACAMRAAGLTRAKRAEADGEIQRDDDGEPTGVLLESAQELVTRAIPEPTLEDAVAAMAATQERALSLGLTGVHDLDGSRALAGWQIIRQQGRLRLRVWKSLPARLLDQALALGLRSGLGDEWLRLGGVKLFADGALGPRTAWMLAPYANEPGNCGMPLHEPAELAALIHRASAGGLSVLVHAIGDRANREVLDALAEVRCEEIERGGPRLRHRIEHVQVLHPDDLGRLAELDLVASMQPIHVTSDMVIADRYWGARSTGAYAFRSLLTRGTALAFGSDSPVETMSPLAGIHAAVTRRRADGSPGDAGWQSQERLTVTEALRAYTAGPALAAGEEADKGSLAPGRLADLVVLDRDLAAIPAMELRELRVLGTMVNGLWAWSDRDFDPGDGHGP